MYVLGAVLSLLLLVKLSASDLLDSETDFIFPFELNDSAVPSIQSLSEYSATSRSSIHQLSKQKRRPIDDLQFILNLPKSTSTSESPSRPTSESPSPSTSTSSTSESSSSSTSESSSSSTSESSSSSTSESPSTSTSSSTSPTSSTTELSSTPTPNRTCFLEEPCADEECQTDEKNLTEIKCALDDPCRYTRKMSYPAELGEKRFSKSRGCASDYWAAIQIVDKECVKFPHVNRINGQCLCFEDKCNGPSNDAKLDLVKDPKTTNVHFKRRKNGAAKIRIVCRDIWLWFRIFMGICFIVIL